jgi:hypothetical protein
MACETVEESADDGATVEVEALLVSRCCGRYRMVMRKISSRMLLLCLDQDEDTRQVAAKNRFLV